MKKAIALKYNKETDNAPKINAKGDNKTALKILEIAQQHNIPIKEDKDLVELLSKVEIDEEIPPQMYKAIAELFSFIYKASKS